MMQGKHIYFDIFNEELLENTTRESKSANIPGLTFPTGFEDPRKSKRVAK